MEDGERDGTGRGKGKGRLMTGQAQTSNYSALHYHYSEDGAKPHTVQACMAFPQGFIFIAHGPGTHKNKAVTWWKAAG
jgi:hypothetical protein